VCMPMGRKTAGWRIHFAPWSSAPPPAREFQAYERTLRATDGMRLVARIQEDAAFIGVESLVLERVPGRVVVTPRQHVFWHSGLALSGPRVKKYS
jgi:hypothetical protein